MSSPWLKFYPSAWRSDPALRMCSVAARGFWMEMLCVMHEASPRGSLLVNGNPVTDRQIAGIANVSLKEATTYLSELEAAGVFSREGNGTVYSRRMRRDEERAARDKANGGLGGSPDLVGGIPKGERARRISRKDNPTKVEAVWAASGGKCACCSKEMQRERPNDPDAFTVDHVIALAAGGDNDLANLQALCRACNRRKGITPTGRGAATGDKAKKLDNLEPRKSSEANASGAEAPVLVSPKDRVWAKATDLSVRANKPEASVRTFLGKCLSEFDADVVERAVLAAIAEGTGDPCGLIARILKPAQPKAKANGFAVANAFEDFDPEAMKAERRRREEQQAAGGIQ